MRCPRVGEVALGDAGPGGDVAAAGRAERRQVAGEHERGGVGGVGQRAAGRRRSSAAACRPRTRPAAAARAAAACGRRSPTSTARRSRRRTRRTRSRISTFVRGSASHARQLGGDLRLVEVRVRLAPLAHLRLPGQLRVRGVVGGGGDVQREPHDRRLHDAARAERRLQVVAREAVEPGGERDVRRGRVLALQRRQPVDRLGRSRAAGARAASGARPARRSAPAGSASAPAEPRSHARATAVRRRSGSGRGARRRPRRRCSSRRRARGRGARCARRPRTSRRP